MRKNLKLFPVICVLILVSLANADVIFEDDFPGSSLDTNKWTSSGTVTVASSVVSLGGQSKIETIESFDSSSGEITVNLTNWNSRYKSGVYFGFHDATDSNVFCVMTNNSTLKIDVTMRKDGGAWQTYNISMNPSYFQLNWTMTLSPTKMTFSHDIAGWMTPFDTDVQSPNGGGEWAIPTVPMKVYLMDAYASSTTSLDKIMISQIPEPLTMTGLLLGYTSLSLLRRRNRIFRLG